MVRNFISWEFARILDERSYEGNNLRFATTYRIKFWSGLYNKIRIGGYRTGGPICPSSTHCFKNMYMLNHKRNDIITKVHCTEKVDTYIIINLSEFLEI